MIISTKFFSRRSTSLHPRSSVTDGLQYWIEHVGARTMVMVSASSVTSRSAHRLRLVNSQFGACLEDVFIVI